MKLDTSYLKMKVLVNICILDGSNVKGHYEAFDGWKIGSMYIVIERKLHACMHACMHVYVCCMCVRVCMYVLLKLVLMFPCISCAR